MQPPPHGWPSLLALLVFLASAVPVSGGCGQDAGEADCITNCNFQTKNCGFGVKDCAAQCDTSSEVDDAGCKSQYDAYAHCAVVHLVCNDTACTEEQQDFFACTMSYCDALSGHSAICPPP